MKLKMKDVFKLSKGLSDLSSGFKLPATIAFKVSRNEKKIAAEISLYNEHYTRIIQENAILGSDGLPEVFEENGQKIYKFKDGCAETAVSEISSLESAEIDIDLSTLSISEFKSSDGKDLDIYPHIFSDLDIIINEV